jgi:hypothetical protein
MIPPGREKEGKEMSEESERGEVRVPGPLPEVDDPAPLAWELIDTGRYMPRRIRGSFPGRELG